MELGRLLLGLLDDGVVDVGYDDEGPPVGHEVGIELLGVDDDGILLLGRVEDGLWLLGLLLLGLELDGTELLGFVDDGVEVGLELEGAGDGKDVGMLDDGVPLLGFELLGL